MMATVLVVDDEARIRDVVQYSLEREGHKVRTAENGHQALDIVAKGGVDLMILDVLMPELDGLAVCRRIRDEKKLALPIIFLSSRAEEVDRILGLDLGGDDYLAKPFSPRELATRVKAVLRRAGVTPPPADAPENGKVVVYGEIEVDRPRHQVRVKGTAVEMTVTEFGILEALLERPGIVLSRAQLIDRAYPHENNITERTIDTHVKRIRAKLKPFGLDPIGTVHGVGYKASEL
jgi:two-component system OmpR family response regulator